jgi:hypothetical protein
MVVTYLCLYYYVLWNPGYLPLGTQRLQYDENEKHSKRSHPKRRRRRGSSRKAPDPEKTQQPEEDVESGVLANAGNDPYQLDLSGLEKFYTKDVFVCQEDGRPPWCTSCCIFKPDRSHHCRELGRCVRKMDHFCPWYICLLAVGMNFLLTYSLGLEAWYRRPRSNFSFNSSFTLPYSAALLSLCLHISQQSYGVR